jgi:hypothetical protein
MRRFIYLGLGVALFLAYMFYNQNIIISFLN